MSETPERQNRIAHLNRLREAFEKSAVVASVVGRGPVSAFHASRAQIAVVASIELKDMADVVAELRDGGKFFFLNIDSCRGLAQDKGALEYLRSLRVPGVVSTRTALVERAKALGQATMQKVFVTDRSNLPRSVTSTAMSKPDLLELMPWPVVPRIEKGVRAELSPFVAAGFVQRRTDVSLALALGAKAAATSDQALWDAPAEELRAAARAARAAQQD
ncbi:glycerol uptake operon antiterminator [Spinactinospora alkalitolerans]|uniref:Glycerol uptake operon antiterminator n=1 Tax=Spinactinospora alkalitolerans TaxID=687207 RepID=A0A852TX53_9ACTN|nr:glycerol-3-phosphate responsive antiterminator [Spinactinospora alkalitolerans]NYE47955.1 glycerol uptake operon antiterminator [Spinactinospora alkalitolerans]